MHPYTRFSPEIIRKANLIFVGGKKIKFRGKGRQNTHKLTITYRSLFRKNESEEIKKFFTLETQTLSWCKK